MSYIQTVTGPVPADQITFCHCHEHLMICKGVSSSVNPSLCIDDYEKTLSELKTFAASGGSAIVDAQPVGCSRMADALAGLAQDSKLIIIASTGFHKMMFYPDRHWIFKYTEDQLAEIFLHEISTGMYIGCDQAAPNTWINAKAGMIKCAYDTCGLDIQYKKLFNAAVSAAKETHLPFMVHIEQGSDPMELVAYLEARQMDLNRVIFCHMDRACPNLSVHKQLCEKGIYLEYDTIGRFKYHDAQHEAAIFSELINSGYGDRLLFSLDTTRERLKSYTPDGVGLTYILNTFIPLLKETGISDLQIQKIACQNPRRVLALPDLP